MKSAKGADRAVKLQRKIFTRWANQRLVRRSVQVDDIVTAVHDGVVLITLMEVLSEKKYSGKPLKNSAMRVQKIDNVNNALNFVWSCGVQTKVKPSAENLVDGTDKPILGLIFAIMEKFVKHADEDADSSLNMREAVMKWVQAQLAEYPDIKIDNFTGSFQSGLALCALIHKHRPDMIDLDTLPKGDNMKVIEVAFKSAEKALGMEKFLTPEEFLCLDESSMLVYLGEYYLAISQWKKYGMAANRISKLIKTTKLHDNLKSQYDEKAEGLIKWIDTALEYLSDRTIDDTLEGAQLQLKDFYEFKSRGNVFMIQSKLESTFNNIAVKLAYSNRPPYVPAPGLTLSDLQLKLKELQDLYQDKRAFLQNELNRQIRLAALDEQHKARASKLVEWLSAKEIWLQKEEGITSVSTAQMQIRLLDAFERESDKLYKTNFSSRLPDIEEEVNVLKTMFKGSPVYLQTEVQKVKHKRLVDELTERLVLEDEHDMKKDDAPLEKQKPKYFVSHATYTLRDLGTELSNERYEKVEGVIAREKDIELRFLKLWELAKSKRPTFLALLERELVKEKLKVDLQRVSNEFLHWAKDAIDRVDSDNSFGFALSEADAPTAEKELNENDADINLQISERYIEYSKVIQKLQDYANENVSTYLPLTNKLQAAKFKLEACLVARRGRYNAQLQKQLATDSLCKEFAVMADDLYKWIVFAMENVTSAQQTLDAQLEVIKQKISQIAEREKVVTQLQDLANKLDASGVTYNPYTTLTYKDILMQWDQYKEFLHQKEMSTNEEITITKRRGVTSEQIKEIERSFNMCDTNKDGYIDKKELKRCLYSLGEERDMRDIEQIIDEYGRGDTPSNSATTPQKSGSSPTPTSTPTPSLIDLKHFQDFMVRIFGATGAKEEILESFDLFTKGEGIIRRENMEIITRVMNPQDLEYFTDTAPMKDAPPSGGYDYKSWTDDMFSR